MENEKEMLEGQSAEEAVVTEEEVTAAVEEAVASEEEAPSEENAEEVQEQPQEAAAEAVAAKEEKKGGIGKVVVITVISTVLAIALLLGMVYLVLTGAGIIGNEPTEPEVTEPVTSHGYTVDDATAAAKSGDVVATVGKEQMTNADLQIYYETNILNYGYTMMYMGADPSQPLDNQIFDQSTGQTWQDVMLETAMQQWQAYAAIRQHAEATGFTLDEEDQAYLATLDGKIQDMAVQSGCETAEQMVKEQLAPGATVEAFRKYLEWDYYYGQYLSYMKEQVTPTQEKMEQYYTENEETLKAQNISKEAGDVVDVRHVLIKPEGGTTNENNETVYSEEAWEACRQKAQELYDGWLAGEANEDTFSQLAKDNSQDGNAADGGLYTRVAPDDMVEEFDSWIFDESRVFGDSGLVKTKFGYHIMFFVKREAKWIEETKNYIIEEAIYNLHSEVIEAYPLQANLDAVVLSK